MLSDTLHRIPGIGSAVYQHLDAHSRRAMRLVCKQLRAAINCAVSGLEMILSDRDDPDEVLQRLARASLRPSKLYLGICSKAITQLTLLAAALLAQELVPVLHGVQHLTLFSVLPLSAALVMSSAMPHLTSLDVECHVDVAVCRAWQRLPQLSSLTLALTPARGAAAASLLLKGLEHITSLRYLDLAHSDVMVDEGSLAACTQLTALRGCRWFPALTQLTQLLQLGDVQDLSSDSLPLLATLPQLADLRLQSCPLQPSSQLSRFLFQHLTSLTVDSIHSRDLAALDCPQLQTLAVRQLQVDCAASLHACAKGILQHCCGVYDMFTYNHGQEFKAAAAGAEVRQLGPPPSASALLEALAPWQPRSGKAIEMLVLGRLSDVTSEALEWLPVNIKYLELKSCHLLPGALSSVATRLTQLTCLDLITSPVALAELQLLAARAQQGDTLRVYLAKLLWALSVMRVVDRQLVERVAELLLQGPLAGTGLGAGGQARPGVWAGLGAGVEARPRVPWPQPRSSLDSCDDLLPRSSAASLLQQLGWVEGDEEDEDGEWAEVEGLPPCYSLLPLVEEGQRLDREQQLVLDQRRPLVVYDQAEQGCTTTPKQQQQQQLSGSHPQQPCQPPAQQPPGQRAASAQPSPTPLAQLSSTCLVQLLWAFASHEHCQAALLRAAAPVLSARILQGQLSSRRVACVAWAYARLQQLEPRLLAAILCTGGRPGPNGLKATVRKAEAIAKEVQAENELLMTEAQLLHAIEEVLAAEMLDLEEKHQHLQAAHRQLRLDNESLEAVIEQCNLAITIARRDVHRLESQLRKYQRRPLLTRRLVFPLSLNAAGGTGTMAAQSGKATEKVVRQHLVAAMLYALDRVPVDEGSLAACTQLTTLLGCQWFPALTQLTQLQQLEYVKDLSSDSLPLLATLPQLVNLSLLTCPLQPSSQLSRFLFQHLTSLTVDSIHSRDLAALDCPQLQTLTLSELQVDSAASLRACASGILHHCNDIYKLFTYDHGQEFKSAAAGAEVRQLGPPPSTSALLEALAPWQPRSGIAIEELGLWHLSDVTREALEWLPVNIKSLKFESCHLLPGVLSSVATRLTQLTCLDLITSPVALAELQLLAARAQQGASLQVHVPNTMSKEDVASLESFISYTQSWTGEAPFVLISA
ncbi:hypothetical protein QJQ45_007574 [Haematococcus lacustris]|nr:hypothetical protein QJQ45_007574 [Haematococcus lacustris]